MKKILAALLAVMMIATLCVISASAWAEADDAAASGWTRHHIFDAKLVGADGADYAIPADYSNGQADGSFQFWKDAGHLYNGKGLNVMSGAKVVINFKGTGIKLGTSYRNDSGFSEEDIAVTLDGADKSSKLTGLIAPSNNNTEHTAIFTAEGLEAGEHTVEFTCTSPSYRFSLDYYEIKDEGAEAPKTVKFKKAVVFAPDETGYSEVWFYFNGLIDRPQGGYEAGWGVGIKNDDGTYTTCDSNDWAGCTWDDSTGVTIFKTNFDKKWDENHPDQDLYELAKQGKVYGIIVEVPPTANDGSVSASNSDTLIKSTEFVNTPWGECTVAAVKATADGAAQTGDALIAVVAVVVAAAAGVVLSKKH